MHPTSAYPLLTTVDQQFNQHAHPVNRVLAASDAHGWDGFIVRSYVLHPAPDPLLSLADLNVLVLHLDGSLHLSCDHGTQHERAYSQPGGMCLIPHAEPTWFSWTQPASIAHIYLPPALIATAAAAISAGDPSRVELVSRFNEHDALVHQITYALLAELRAGGIAGPIYAESLCHTLTLHLLRTASSLTVTRASPHYGLSPRELQRVVDYINDQLPHALTLRDLAATVNLSPSHFTRVFKHSLGLAPHQYLIQQRIERAKTLLLAGNTTIATVAHRVGFADHSHLNRHFKRAFGVAPGVVLQSANVHNREWNIQDAANTPALSLIPSDHRFTQLS